MRKMTLTLLTAATLSSLAFAGMAQAADQTLRIAVESDYAPFSSKDQNGKLVGFEIDLADKICAVAKLKCSYVVMDFDAMIAAVKANKADVILDEMSITEDRAKEVAFSDVITIAPVSYVAKKGSLTSSSAAGVKGKVIGVQSGTTHEKYLDEVLKDTVVKKVYTGIDQAYLDLESGRVDAVMADKTQEWDWLSKTGLKAGYDYAGEAITDVKYFGIGTGGAFRKGDARIPVFNKALAEVIKSGDYKIINDKYFPFPLVYTGK